MLPLRRAPDQAAQAAAYERRQQQKAGKRRARPENSGSGRCPQPARSRFAHGSTSAEGYMRAGRRKEPHRIDKSPIPGYTKGQKGGVHNG